MNNINLPVLTPENYYADKYYLSASALKSIAPGGCEAAAMAEFHDEYKRPSSVALLVGGYLDAAVDGPGAMEKYRIDHPEIFNSRKPGELKAEYRAAEEVLRAIDNQHLFRAMLGGSHQLILTGTISGAPIKGKPDIVLSMRDIDVIQQNFPETSSVLAFQSGCIVDLKYMSDVSEKWDDSVGEKVPFWRFYHYDWQLAIYQELYFQRYGVRLPCVLAVATKETPSGLHLFHFSQPTLDAALAEVEDLIPYAVALRSGQATPTRCENCAYCRATRVLSAITPAEFAGM